jgi:hypothetical protein
VSYRFSFSFSFFVGDQGEQLTLLISLDLWLVRVWILLAIADQLHDRLPSVHGIWDFSFGLHDISLLGV